MIVFRCPLAFAVVLHSGRKITPSLSCTTVRREGKMGMGRAKESKTAKRLSEHVKKKKNITFNFDTICGILIH
jgi:hypothetical protein